VTQANAELSAPGAWSRSPKWRSPNADRPHAIVAEYGGDANNVAPRGRDRARAQHERDSGRSEWSSPLPRSRARAFTGEVEAVPRGHDSRQRHISASSPWTTATPASSCHPLGRQPTRERRVHWRRDDAFSASSATRTGRRQPTRRRPDVVAQSFDLRRARYLLRDVTRRETPRQRHLPRRHTHDRDRESRRCRHLERAGLTFAKQTITAEYAGSDTVKTARPRRPSARTHGRTS